jgi:uncharacterized membrane protein YebE (DUF533 family)
VKELLNMAEQVDEDASSKDLEYLINENTRRVADLEDLVEEAGDSQLAEEAYCTSDQANYVFKEA